MGKTKIEWTDATWNPVTGCSHAGTPGCDRCYAKRMATRLAGRYGYPKENPFAVTVHPERLEEPLHWRKPSMVFVCSMGDLFHDDVPTEWIEMVFTAMALTPRHTYLLLTKRPERMSDFLNSAYYRWTLSNVWLGVTAENQAAADGRIPLLLQTPAAKRFVSCEPLLGPTDLAPWLSCSSEAGLDGQFSDRNGYRGRLHWVIAGGETGPGARPMHPEWARSLRDQCQAAGVPFFFKHHGEWYNGRPMNADMIPWLDIDEHTRMWHVGKQIAGRALDGREWNEAPT
jgi:protein gp37